VKLELGATVDEASSTSGKHKFQHEFKQLQYIINSNADHISKTC